MIGIMMMMMMMGIMMMMMKGMMMVTATMMVMVTMANFSTQRVHHLHDYVYSIPSFHQAYKNFSLRVNNLRKRLAEFIKILPDPEEPEPEALSPE